MTTRIEIIAEIDVQISRLERARDFLTASLAGSKKDAQAASAIASLKKLKATVPARKRTHTEAATVPAAVAAPPPPPPQPKEEPQVKRVPPKRRMERRHAQADKAARSAVALSGMVPAGPVVVSANEARKVQERAVQPAMPPVAAEPRPEAGGERSLGSLIQAFERRAGLSGLETP